MTPKDILKMTVRVSLALSVIAILSVGFVQAQLDPRISLTPSEENWLKRHPVIRLGVDPNAPPTEYVDRDGTYSGIASGIVQLVSERLGIEFVVEKGLSWPQVLEKAGSRDVDLLPCVARTKEREEYLLFTGPYLNVPVAIVTKTDAPYIESMEDLKGKTVAVVRGYQLHERIKTEYPEMVLVVSNSTAEALQAVSTGKAFAFPGNLAQTFYLMPKLGISNLKVAAPTKYSYAPCFGVRGDWPEFRSILDKALATITPEERTVISQKWIALDRFFGLDPAAVLKWVGAGAILLILLVLWNVQVRRQKRIVQESEQRLQTIMDSIPNAVFVTDGHGRKVMVNKEWERITKRDRGQAVGKTYEELYPKRLAEKLAAADRKVMETLQPLSSEESIRTGQGERTFVQSLRPLTDVSGRPYAICGSATDITERKLAEEKLQRAYAESERLLADAAHYVQALLPEPMNVRGISADWRFRPSAALGGDCFGYHWLDSDHFALYLLDVSGHGVSASLLAVAVLNLLRSQTLKDADFYSPGSVLKALNNAFQMDDHNGMFLTIWYGVYSSSSGTLVFSSGGHPPALLIGHESGESMACSYLRTPNLFVGALPDVEYEQTSAPIPAGSSLYVFSDGVFEFEENGSIWGYENFENFVVLASGSGAPILDRLVDRVTLLTQGLPLDDDFSIVEIKFS